MSGATLTEAKRRRQYSFLAAAAAVTVPGVVLSRTHTDLSYPVLAVIFGLAIVGAAFLLSWAAEVAQLDISAGLAIALLAFIAVLPEYAVDLVFALNGGEAYAEFGPICQSAAEIAEGRESNCALALANMTGANRLLIGLGWSMVVFIAWWRLRKRGERMEGVALDRSHAVELSFLSVATVYSLTLPMKRSITLIDAAILVSIFVAYMIRISKAPAEEPHLVGPAEALGELATPRRRMAVVGLFVVAALVILACAEEFAHALVETGGELGISEFFLVQWLAPLASEAPELLVAGLYAYRLNTNAGLGTLVSSKVNQWTLLVGTLPI
ncbi:MAG: sodium:proton exchanger, partial [Acidimicrobiia bacterium]